MTERLSLKYMLLAIAVVLALTVALLAVFTGIYAAWIWFFGISLREFNGTLPNIYVAIIGIAVTVVTIVETARTSRRNQRKKDTINILFESRLTPYHQSLQQKMQVHFPLGETVSLDDFKKLGKSKKPDEKEAADAVVQALNYHEYIAAGIRKGNLDEEMLRETVRGVVCRQVFERRNVIRYYRVEKDNEKTFEHLVAIYWQWVDKGKPEEFDTSMGKDDGYFDR